MLEYLKKSWREKRLEAPELKCLHPTQNQTKPAIFNDLEPKVAERDLCDFRHYFQQRISVGRTGTLESATLTAIYPGPASFPPGEADE